MRTHGSVAGDLHRHRGQFTVAAISRIPRRQPEMHGAELLFHHVEVGEALAGDGYGLCLGARWLVSVAG